ncbi:photosynthetic complex putative assembly protein PuhB [Rhodoferax antarcticus]|uniref:photosynthetic complex putative assembly protein PuhB n=1 Tax=Rhodoferax antarcticus TaxID=81479 RepID=UPI002224A532|nr:photosynthetic complex putative assembly protein PuhB [Rhodoferax antarcticus]MCW2310423.1 hypothetical protein [Rhodoferax antarcticus]
MKASHEHEFEAAPGLPELLPSDEKILWQGAPSWSILAIQAFHLRKIGIYFLCLIALECIFLVNDGVTSSEIFTALVKSSLIAALALSMLGVVVWFSTKTTMYTITDKRVIMRIGIVLTLTFNLPHQRIASASIKNYKGGSGDLALSLYPTDRIAWLHLWPHARPWKVGQPEPALRCIAQVDKVSSILLSAWQQVNQLDKRQREAAYEPRETQAEQQGQPA